MIIICLRIHYSRPTMLHEKISLSIHINKIYTNVARQGLNRQTNSLRVTNYDMCLYVCCHAKAKLCICIIGQTGTKSLCLYSSRDFFSWCNTSTFLTNKIIVKSLLNPTVFHQNNFVNIFVAILLEL